MALQADNGSGQRPRRSNVAVAYRQAAGTGSNCEVKEKVGRAKVPVCETLFVRRCYIMGLVVKGWG